MNIHGRRSSFVIWIFTNAIWTAADLLHGLRARAGPGHEAGARGAHARREQPHRGRAARDGAEDPRRPDGDGAVGAAVAGGTGSGRLTATDGRILGPPRGAFRSRRR